MYSVHLLVNADSQVTIVYTV